MKLTGEEYKKLQIALLSAFSSEDKLAQMVKVILDQNLKAIAGGEDLAAITFNLIQWAESMGELEKLIRGAYEEKSGNPELRTFYDEWSLRKGQELLQPKAAISPLLPYSPNRDEQEFELHQAIQLLLQRDIPHPLVCIIHGDEFQSHDKFLERLQKFSLPRLLKLNENHRVKEYPLNWPSKLKKLDELNDRLCKNLSDQVLGYSSTSPEEIHEIFCKYHPNPTIIHTHLLTDDWEKHKFEILRHLLGFWQNWPALVGEQRLIVCVFIKYQEKRRNQIHRFSISAIFSYLSKLLKSQRYRKINARIYRELQELEKSEVQHFHRLSFTVLSELEDIGIKEVEDWIRSKETEKFVGKEMREKLMREVRELFENREKIPMEELADNLIELLTEVIGS